MYLLDTNICIYIINHHPKQVIERVKKLKPHQIKLSSISIGELEYGVSKSNFRDKNRKALIGFASAFDIIDFNDSDAEVYGIIRAELERKGQIIGPWGYSDWQNSRETWPERLATRIKGTAE